jgi:hypothetical protein
MTKQNKTEWIESKYCEVFRKENIAYWSLGETTNGKYSIRAYVTFGNYQREFELPSEFDTPQDARKALVEVLNNGG